MYTGIYVKYPLFCQNLMTFKFSRQIFKQSSITKIRPV